MKKIISDILNALKLFLIFIKMTILNIKNLKYVYMYFKNNIRNEIDENKILEEREKFKELKKTLTNKEMIEWKNFIKTCLIIQGILLSFLVWHLIYLDIIGIIYMAITFIGSIIFFGYRAWIIKTQRYGSFMSYLKDIPNEYKVLWLLPFYNKLDKICQHQ